MPQLARKLVKERAQLLREDGARALTGFMDAQAGREAEILLEREDFGRTEQFAETQVDVAGEPGGLRRARITGHDGRKLLAEVIG